ncbi:magnesium transporter CorA family protein [archaeon]|jgi:magnesium transporter|nr:magnesium transporter CorA family protein [archaeon]
MIEYYQKSEEKDGIEKVKEFSKGCWINVINPNQEEMGFVVEKFKLSESNIVDGLDIHENPRFEIEDSKTYIYLTAPTNKIRHEYDSSFLIIYSKDYFMTVAKNSLEIFDKILDPKTTFKKFTSSRNLVKILFLLSRMFENSVHKILKDTKTNRTDLSKLKNKDIEKLINYEDKLNTYIASFGSTINTYSRILRDKSVKFIKKDEETIEDLIIDLNETLNLCKQTLKTISNMRTYYSTKLSNDLNKTVSLLTLVTIFISIPTLISSIYGMNIDLPLQGSPKILLVLLGVAIVICGLFVVLLKRKKII